MVASSICPRCGGEPEILMHVITRCGPDQRETMKTHWKPPQDPNVKVNFDAAFKSFSAEAIACIQALKFAEEMGFRQIEVEGDSRTTIMIINQGVVDRSTMGVYIEDVKAMATRFQRISFKHVDRKANGVGHIIAQERFNLTENTFWVEEVPVAAVEAVN